MPFSNFWGTGGAPTGHALHWARLRGCLYGGEPARVPGLARLAEMISSRVSLRRRPLNPWVYALTAIFVFSIACKYLNLCTSS